MIWAKQAHNETAFFIVKYGVELVSFIRTDTQCFAIVSPCASLYVLTGVPVSSLDILTHFQHTQAFKDTGTSGTTQDRRRDWNTYR